MFKNVSGQKVALFAFDSTTGAPKTGDAANITPYITKDGGSVTALTDSSATEMSSTNAPGWYLFDVSQSESNADNILFTGKSSTSNVVIVGKEYCTAPPNFTAQSIDGNGRLDVIKVAGTTQTAGDLAALINTIDDFLDTEVAAIKAKTDNLPSDPADASDIAALFARLTGLVLAQGTIGSTGNDTTHLHLDGLTYGDDEINNCLIVIRDVSENEYHARWVTDWVLSTELATVATLPFTPQDATDTYWLLPIRQDVTGGSGLDAAGVRAAIGLSSANLDTQLTAIDDFLDTEVAAIKAKTDNLPSDPADASDIAGAFSTLSAKVDTIDDFLDTEIAAIKAKTDQLTFTVANQVDSNALSGGGGLDAAGVRAAIGLASANLDTQLAAIDDFLDTEVAAIKAKTDNLPSDPADASDIAGAFSTLSAKVDTIDDFLDTEVAAIKAKTDQLTFTVANRVDSQVLGIANNAITAASTAADFVAELTAQNGLLLIAKRAATTLRFLIASTSSQNVYFVIWKEDGSEVFDFNDNTFKALGSATTPYVAASEVTNPAGAGQSWYTATVNMTLLASGLVPADIAVEAFARSGGSPAPTTDAALASPVSRRIRFGMSDPALGGRVTPILKRELDTWAADFTVTADGTPVSFEGTGVLTVRAENGLLLFSALSSSTVTDSGDSLKHLRFEKSTPGFTGDRDYSGRVVITQGSTTFTIQDTFQILA